MAGTAKLRCRRRTRVVGPANWVLNLVRFCYVPSASIGEIIMSAFEEMTKAQSLQAKRRLSEALGTGGLGGTRRMHANDELNSVADALGGTIGGLSRFRRSGVEDVFGSTIAEALGAGGFGSSRRMRVSDELNSAADALGGTIGGLSRSHQTDVKNVFGSTVAEALGTGGFDSSRRMRASDELNFAADALGGTISGLGRSRRTDVENVFGSTVAEALGLGGLGRSRRFAAEDVFGSTIAEALGSGIGGHAKAHKRLREAFAEPMPDWGVSARTRSDMEKIERHLADAQSFIARAEPVPEAIRLPQPPPNPVHETNRHLRQVAEKIDALLEVQAQQAKLVDALLQAQIAAGRDQNRIWRRDHRFTVMGLALSLLAVLVSVVF